MFKCRNAAFTGIPTWILTFVTLLLLLLAAPLARAQETEASSDADASDADALEPAAGVAPEASAAIRYKPGRWLFVDLPHHTTVRFRLMLEPMFRYSSVVAHPGDSGPDDTIDLIIRRGRVGFQIDAPHGLGFRFEMSVKNMHSEIHNMFGYWKPQKHLELQFGFIKAPGGLERDTFSFDQPFIERSVITFFNRDHEVGVKAAGESCDERWRWAAAITRDPPPLPGGDPEDSPQIPTGVEAEDIARPASKWASEGRVALVPSHAFEASLNAGVRIRPEEPDFGEIAVEPYDTTFLTNRPYRGTMFRVGGDVAISEPHWKLVAEAGFRRDGEQLAYPDGTVASETELGGHLTAEAAYVVFGWTPGGKYGAAFSAAPLRRGWELVTRVMGMRVKPVDTDAATFYSAEVGWHWEATKHLRLQVDAALERFGDADVTLLNENRASTRLYAQTWAVFRL